MEKECIEYFKNNKGFNRLFEGLREKYRSLGNLGGIVKLNDLTKVEKDALSGLFKRDYYSKTHANIKVEQLYKAFNNTKFEGVDLEAVVRGYFKGQLMSKKEEMRIYNLNKKTFFKEIMVEFEGTRAFDWLESILKDKSNAYRTLSKNYDTNKDKLRINLILTMKGLNNLSFISSDHIRLALFSSIISKDPHFFDNNTLAGNLLIYGITHFLNLAYPKDAEEKAEILYRAGLIKDEISNYTTMNGLIAYKDGLIHKGWHGFYKYKEPVNITLLNLSEIDRIYSSNHSVFVFENPTVFSQVLDTLRDKNPPLICTYGQIKLASLVLLDKLIDNVQNIYYSGDFDPEGLQIADKLKTRYGTKLKLWRFNIGEYESVKSSKIIEPERMKKFDKIKAPELQGLAEHIKNEGLAAYQELLTKKYIEDIKKEWKA